MRVEATGDENRRAKNLQNMCVDAKICRNKIRQNEMTSEKSIPLWLSISKALEKDLESGLYGVGSILPKEIELVNIYSASRITIRGALARLEDMGYIRRVKGKGTIVIEKKIKEPLLKIVGFSEEMKELGIVPSTSYAHIERKNVSGYIAELFQNSKSTFFVVLERIRCINDVAVGYFVTYLPAHIGLDLNDDNYYSSLYDYLEKNLNIKIDYVKQSISAEISDKKTRERLNLVAGEPIMVMKRQGFCNGELVEYSVCKYDSKRYEYKMEIKDAEV